MANTNAGKKFFISPTIAATALTLAQFQAITDWVQVSSVGSFGETGTATNILTYDTWDTDVAQKGKGISNAGDPEVELARIPSDPGQKLMRQAAETRFNYPFKIEGNDPAVLGGTPTIRYNRGMVAGPRSPNGRNEDFDLEIFTLALNQKQITVDPSTNPAPDENG